MAVKATYQESDDVGDRDFDLKVSHDLVGN